MSTRVTFDLDSDDPTLKQLIDEIRHDPVMRWRLAVFACQQQLERALKARGVAEHYEKRRAAIAVARAQAKTKDSDGLG